MVQLASDPGNAERLWRRLQPLAVARLPLDVPPPRSTRFVLAAGPKPRALGAPELVAEVKFLTWTEDNLLAPSRL
jgi:ATP-dependent DNA ligase